jgi:hypothetical protein
MLSELRPYRRRLAVMVILAALAGVALGELVPGRRAAPTKTLTTTTSQR